MSEPEGPATQAEVASRLDAIVARWRGGACSAEIALMELLIASESVPLVQAATASAPELARLLAANEQGSERICAMLRSGMDSNAPALTVDEGIASAQRLFDWSVQQSEESSVALYSLGSAEILERATREIVALLGGWGVLSDATRALEIGCGIGRLLLPIAAQVEEVIGIDVSPRMVEVARRRCAGEPRVAVRGCSGRDLAGFADASRDLVYAVDSFPYVVQAGLPLAQALFAEIARVLAPGGRFALLGYSYRGDDARDRDEVAALARDAGLTVLVAGERPFALWNAPAFLLQR